MTFQTLPVRPGPNSMEVSLIDMGFVQRGASSLRVDKPGGRYRIGFGFPPMTADDARAFIGPFQRAKRQGLQIRIPMLVSQGTPGAPVVDGAGQAGSALAVRGFVAGYSIKEQYWFTVTRASTGESFLHSVVETVVAGGSGDATIQIEPPLRVPFADGDDIEFATPFMAGFVDGDAYTWNIRTDRFIDLTVTVEEYK